VKRQPIYRQAQAAVVVIFTLLTGCSGDKRATVIAKEAVFNLSVEANGELASSNTAYLSPPSIKRMWRYKLIYMLPEGSQVSKGQVVARFETNTIADKLRQKKDGLSTAAKELENQILNQQKEQQDLKVQLARREVNLRQAQRKTAQLNVTTSTIEAKKLLLDLNIAEQDLALYQHKVTGLADKSALNLAIKKRKKQDLQTNVDHLQSDIDRLSIKATKAGLLVYANNHEGNKFAVGDTLHTGQTFAEIPSLDKMVVKAKVSERNLGKIKTDMAVVIVLDANPGVKYQGKLTSLGTVIREKAKNNPEKVIEAQIDILDPAHDIMRPGMIARIAIVVNRFKDVIVLPNQAISQSGSEATVTVKSTFGEQRRVVKVLASDELNSALSSGIRVGEEVIL
jgi:HlyD family secretion protein